MDAEFKAELQARLDLVKQKVRPPYVPLKLDNAWSALRYSTEKDFDKSPKTAISQSVVDQVAKAITTLPKGFVALKQIEKVIADRKVYF